MSIPSDLIARARSVRIEDEVERRAIGYTVKPSGASTSMAHALAAAASTASPSIPENWSSTVASARPRAT